MQKFWNAIVEDCSKQIEITAAALPPLLFLESITPQIPIFLQTSQGSHPILKFLWKVNDLRHSSTVLNPTQRLKTAELHASIIFGILENAVFLRYIIITHRCWSLSVLISQTVKPFTPSLCHFCGLKCAFRLLKKSPFSVYPDCSWIKCCTNPSWRYQKSGFPWPCLPAVLPQTKSPSGVAKLRGLS